MLDLFTYSIAPLSSIISGTVLPAAACWLCSNRPAVVSRLLLGAGVMISLVVPTVVLIVFGEDCYSHWLLTWEPCQSKDSFVFQARVHRTMIGNSGGDWVDGFWLPITQHADICLPKYTEGKCSRFVVEVCSSPAITRLHYLNRNPNPNSYDVLSLTPTFKSYLWLKLE